MKGKGYITLTIPEAKRLLREDREDYRLFCREQGEWLEDYALFMALKDR